jgi:nucleotide-binding universal stress UspA family protein
MGVVKILAPVTGSGRDAAILSSAFAAAKPFRAHVAALFVHPDPRTAVPFLDFGMPLAPEIVEEIVEDAEKAASIAASRARETLNRCAGGAGAQIVETPERAATVTASFRQCLGRFASCVSNAAKLSDLVVFAPVLAGDSPEIGEALVETLLGCERPVLLSAAEPPAGFGDKIAVAWDGGQAAAHALMAAMPFLEKARSIEFISLRTGNLENSKCAEAFEYLKLYGLACAERDIVHDGSPIGEKLLAEAAKSGADLLVMGGYGHSRLRESIFGGVTAHILSHAKIPALLVH